MRIRAWARARAGRGCAAPPPPAPVPAAPVAGLPPGCAATSGARGYSPPTRPGVTTGPTTEGRWCWPSSAAGPTEARLPARAAPRSFSGARPPGFAGETRAPRGGPSGPLCDALIPVEVTDCSDGGLSLRTVDRLRVDGRCAPVDAAPGEPRTHVLLRAPDGGWQFPDAGPPRPSQPPHGSQRPGRRGRRVRDARRIPSRARHALRGGRGRSGHGGGQRLPVDGATLEEAHHPHVEEADLEQHQERHRGPDVGVDGEPQRAGEVEPEGQLDQRHQVPAAAVAALHRRADCLPLAAGLRRAGEAATAG